jgi:hypothetical protein
MENDKIMSNEDIENYSLDNKFSFIEYKFIKNLFINTTSYNKNKLSELYLDSFIVIIDFPNLGGGAQQFINSIISHFKVNNNFLIIRNSIDEKLLEFSINDNYVLDLKLNNISSIQFFESIKHKIKKIFINHIYNHSCEFIDHLFKLNKKITTITHDYLLICKNEHPFHHLIKSELKKTNFISKCDSIIFQNKNNIIPFKPFITKNNKIIISPLPDFQKSLQNFTTNNEKIVIGIIGAISKQKGSLILQQIITFFENNDKIDIIIFGKTHF